MSIYEGTATEQDYAQGRTWGARDGERDVADWPQVIHEEIEAWGKRARACTLRSERAYCLGWLRGYRDAVRTFERGRWGT